MRLAWANLAVVILTAVMAYAAETVAPKSDVYLIVDYIPVAVYEGDEVIVNLRAENTGAAAIQAQWVLKEVGRDGVARAPQETPVSLKPSGFSSARFSIGANTTQFSVTLQAGEKDLAKLTADVLLDGEAWPKTIVRNGALENANDAGERLVLLTQRRDKKIDRAFLPMKWLLGTTDDKANKKDAPRIARISHEGYLQQPTTVLGPYALDGLPPIVHAAKQILDTLKDEKICVLVLPPEDIEAATDPRVLRIVLETLLVRMKAAGVESIAVLPAFKYGANETLLKSYWKEINEVCAAQQAKFIDPAEFCAEEFWRVDPARAGIYAAKPNAEGRARIDSVIKTLLPNQK